MTEESLLRLYLLYASYLPLWEWLVNCWTGISVPVVIPWRYLSKPI